YSFRSPTKVQLYVRTPLSKDSEIIGIEVKKGTKVYFKSLSVFIQKYKPNYSIRFSKKLRAFCSALCSKKRTPYGLDLISNPQRFYALPIMKSNKLIANLYPYNSVLQF
ncbi:hypothetical protein, partial [Lacrimispora sp.]|uniref:hypothetical protein n=1 Tax=Lacrimispora sp. TaxID=2719234 RepID=UPI0028A9BA64